MIILNLIMANILRWKFRAFFTFMTIVIAFFLLALLTPLNRVFTAGVDIAEADRLIVVNKSSILRPMPISHLERISRLDGIESSGHFTFFGGYYQDQDQQIASIATDPEIYAELVPEVEFDSQENFEKWTREPTGVAAGKDLMEEFGWKIGDIIPIYSAIHQRSNGSFSWTFKIVTVFDTQKKGGNSKSMIINYRHFNESRISGKDTVGWFSIKVENPEKAPTIATNIDKMFSNSSHETKTTTEKAFAQSFLRQVGNFSLLISLALCAVFFTLILVVANTISQSVNERLNEIALLKIIGFGDIKIVSMIFIESLVLAFSGCATAYLLASILIPMIANGTDQLLSSLSLLWLDVIYGCIGFIVLGVFAAIFPAVRSLRIDVPSTLTRTA